MQRYEALERGDMAEVGRFIRRLRLVKKEWLPAEEALRLRSQSTDNWMEEQINLDAIDQDVDFIRKLLEIDDAEAP
jgi:hypothetical protein